MSADLVAFLRARLDEDEQTARAAAEYQGCDRWVVSEVAYEGILVGSLVDGMLGIATPTTRHMARHDPARVFDEVDAKRRILAEHAPKFAPECIPVRVMTYSVADEIIPDTHVCAADGQVWPCTTVRTLALAYADHPDYQQKWRPE